MTPEEILYNVSQEYSPGCYTGWDNKWYNIAIKAIKQAQEELKKHLTLLKDE